MNTVIGVHGFSFDPKSDADNPFKLYHEWSQMLGRPVKGFGWYSAPRTSLAILRAWFTGHLHRYRYAYHRLAPMAADRLAEFIADEEGRVDLICHSLGSRVVMLALALHPEAAAKVDRVLILNGAELVPAVMFPPYMPPPEILNVAVRADDVLRLLGAKFTGRSAPCIGQAGLPVDRPGLSNIFLDDARTQRHALDRRGWYLEGNAPREIGDHWYCYRHRGNWPLYRAFFDGVSLMDLVT